MRRRFLALGCGLVLLACLPGPPPALAAEPQLPNPYSQGPGDIHIHRLTVFGDSYSAPRNSFPDWPELIQAAGGVDELDNAALNGATAVPNRSSLGSELRRWLKQDPAFGPHDLTVVFFGYNDIGKTDMEAAAAAMGDALDRLVAAGATGSGRRLLVIAPHDRSGAPNRVEQGRSAETRTLTLAWRDRLAAMVAARPGTILVDLTAAFDRALRTPARYGFTDLAEAGREPGHLYYDGSHLGARGQAMIAGLLRYYLTQGWDAANRLEAGPEARARLEADIDAGLVFAAKG